MQYVQGIYQVKHPEKYIGQIDASHPRYLSSYELKTFEFFDNHKSVLKWGSECVVIKYKNPTKLDSNGNPKTCRYIIDLYCEYIDKQGQVVKELIEIKPTKDLKKPKKSGRKKQQTYIKEQMTYIQNLAKWQAATAYAKQRGLQFRVITEKDIFA
jgi:hypothetical protein